VHDLFIIGLVISMHGLNTKLYSVGLHSSGVSCGAPFPTHFFSV